MKWVYAIAVLALLACGGFSGYAIAANRYHAKIDRLKIQWQAAQDKAVADTVEQCHQAQAITKETSHDYQEKLADINRRHAASIERVRADAGKSCVPVAGATSRRDAATGSNGVPAALGIQAWDILDDAAACDRNTEQLIACQAWARRATQSAGNQKK